MNTIHPLITSRWKYSDDVGILEAPWAVLRHFDGMAPPLFFSVSRFLWLILDEPTHDDGAHRADNEKFCDDCNGCG